MRPQAKIQDVYPLTPMQEGMLFHNLYEKNSSSYYQQFSLKLEGTIDHEIVRVSLKELIKRHEVLRTAFVHEGIDRVVQVVFQDREPELQYKDISDLENGQVCEAVIKNFKEEDKRRSFDLKNDTLFRVTIFKLSAIDFEFIWSHHHIIMDGWCLGKLLSDFFEIYKGIANNQAVNLRPTIAYKEYIQWLQKQNKEVSLDYWANYLSDYDQLATVSQINNGKSNQYLNKILQFEIDEKRTNQLNKLAARHQITAFTIIQSVWGILLGKYNRTNDVTFGKVVSGRPTEINGIENIIGLFINTVPSRVKFSNSETFEKLLSDVQQASLEGEVHTWCPLSEIQNRSELRQQLFDHILVFENYPIEESLKTNNASGNPLPFKVCHAESFEQTNFALNIIIHSGEKLTVSFNYDGYSYHDAQIEDIKESFNFLIDQVIDNPSIAVGSLKLLSAYKEEQLLDFACKNQLVNYPKEETIVSLFEKKVELFPENIAVSFESGSLTYGELNKEANQLAHFLRNELNVKADDLIGLKVERSLEMIVGILGILKSGAAYVSLDPDHPAERTSFIIRDTGLKAIVVDAPTNDESDVKYVYLNNKKELQKYPETNPFSINKPSDLAYIIYTSGSTGTPKGVMIEHKNVVRLLFNESFQFDFSENDVWTLFHSVCFDFSVWEIFGALLFGGKLVVVTKETCRVPSSFTELLQKEKVTVLNMIPSIFNLVAAEALLHQDFRLYLKYVIFGGEALNPGSLNQWVKKYPSVKMINMYGITETTVHVTYKEIGAKEIEEGTSNIGSPIPTLSIYIMNDERQLLPNGVIGEIVVGGEGVARGYLNREALTKERFIENPYKKGKILYCSGDLGALQAGGDIIYLGRKDHQVKIRGFRIELGEIESALIKIDGIKDAVVSIKEDDDQSKYLVAYIISKGAFEASEIRSALEQSLPEYMVPSLYMAVDNFPRTASGKIDKKALGTGSFAQLKNSFTLAANHLEEQIQQVWQDVLKKQSIGVTDNYFSIGGDSLKAIRLISKLNSKLTAGIKIADLFKNPTIRGLSEALPVIGSRNELEIEHKIGLGKIKELKDKILNDEDQRKLLPSHFEDIYPLVPIETGMIYSSMLRVDEPVYYDQFIYFVQYDNEERIREAVAYLVDRHPILRTQYYLTKFSEPVKVVLSQIEIPISFEDVADLDVSEQKATIEKYKSEDLNLRFSFDGDLLWKLKIYKTSMNHFMVIWSVHHAVLDGWSTVIFTSEIAQLAHSDKLKSLPQLTHSYKDYAAIVLGRQTSTEVYDYWRNKLSGFTRNKLPFNYSRKQIDTSIGAKALRRVIGKEALAQIEKLSSDKQISLKSIFLSAHVYLMHILCAEQDLVTGVVSHDRPAIEDGDKILGCFLNTIPVRINFEHINNYNQLLEITHQYLSDVKQYEIHLSNIAQAVGEKASIDNPIFDCLLNFTDFHILETVEKDSDQSNIHSDSIAKQEIQGAEMTNTYFDLEIDKTLGELSYKIKYTPQYFSSDEISKSIEIYERILGEMIKNPEGVLDVTKLLSTEELHWLQEGFNGTVEAYSMEKTLHELFEIQALKTPEKEAVVSGALRISYKELNEQSNKIARYLIESGVNNGDNVGLITGRGIEMISGMLGILKSGAAYVPIDPEYPCDRQEYIINNSSAAVVLVDKAYPVMSEATSDINFLSIAEALKGDYSEENLNLPKSSADLAYTIYTSGSTGRPKGVMIEHHSAVNLVEWVNKEFKVGESDRLLFVTSMCFDLSVYDIFGMLSCGGTIVVAQREEVQDSKILQQLLIDEQITFWDSVPTTMNYLVGELEQAGAPYLQMKLRLVFMSGDWIPVQLPGRLKRYFPSAQVISLGGATEGTVWSNYYPIEEVKPEWSSIPYGKPISNNFFYVLNDKLQPVPQGVAGELYIGGVGVARGYANDPEKTAQSFMEDPFNKELGGRMYKTGDLGRILPDGNMEFLGRKDHQVKIRGFRVELGEIESQLQKHDKIREAVVEARKDGSNQNYLCAYIVGEGISARELREYLEQKLPAYMIPVYVVSMDKLPLTSNGKINRKALPEPQEQDGNQRAYVAPVTEIEKHLASIWEEILSTGKVGSIDNFLELGAHSLNIGSFINRVHREYEILLTIQEIFNHPTVSEIGQLIENKEKNKFYSIEEVEEQSYYAVSHAQKRLWVIHQLDKENSGYNLPGAYVFKGTLNKEILAQTFETLVARHESLRTTFITVDGEPKQKINKAEESGFKLEYTDLREAVDKEKQARVLAGKEASTIFDLEKGPLLKVRLLQLEEEHYVLLFTMHHIISDGWSLAILLQEVQTLYFGAVKGEVSPLSPLRIQYKDYSAWQQKQLSGEQLRDHQSYWHHQFEDDIPVLDLPTDFTRPAVKTYRGSRATLGLEKELREKLHEVSRKEGVTFFMTLVASVNALLYKYTGQEDIVVGTPVAGRDHKDLEDQIGIFVNNLPLRTRFRGEASFEELLQQVKSNTLEAFSHQVYPFDRLVDDLKLHRDLSRSPLFDVVVLLQDIQVEASQELETKKGLSVDYFNTGYTTSLVDIRMIFDESEGGLNIAFEYNTDLFTRERVEKMLAHYRHLLNSITENITTPVSKLEYLSNEEKQALLNDFNATSYTYTKGQTITDLIEAQAKSNPDSVAVIYNEKQLTYKALNEQSNQLAAYLEEESKVKVGDKVGVMVDKSEQAIIAFVAILKAGGVYVPIDPSHPEERIRYMIEDTGLQVLLTQSEYIFNVGFYTGEIFALDLQLESLEKSKENRHIEGREDAYVIYTSGSTGRPKGVLLGHEGLVNLSYDHIEKLGIKSEDHFLQFMSLSFDGSVLDICVTLAAGATLVMIGKETINDREAFLRYIEEKEVSIVVLPPSYITVLNQHPLPTVRIMISAGEAANVKDAVYYGSIKSYYNSYGPSEATVCTTQYKVEAGRNYDRIPIGKPGYNKQVYVLDKDNQLVGSGITGEICIAGEGLAKGYLNQPELTSEKFIQNPYGSGRLYKTGDLGRWQADGNLEYLGRKDSQVKLRGYRIELGEIEEVLQSHEGVEQAVVIIRGEGSAAELTGYIQSKEEGIEKEVKTYLSTYLPQYMIPTEIIRLKVFPVTSNGKVDRRELATKTTKGLQRKETYVGPRNKVEEQLAQIWEEVLGIEKVGIDENFFELGGHSLKAVQMISSIHKILNAKADLRVVFSNPTVRILAEAITNLKQCIYDEIRPLEKQPYYDVSHGQKRLWILNQFEESQTAYNIASAFVFTGKVNAEALEGSFKKLIERHESLRTTFITVNGEPKQKIHDENTFEFNLNCHDLRNEQEPKEVARILANKEAYTSFDLEKGPLLRAHLLQIEEEKHIFLFTMHHIISDGWSMEVLVREVMTLYNAFDKGYQKNPLSPLRLQYKDYASWQNNQLKGENLKVHFNYWMNVFEGDIPVLKLPLDFDRPAIKTYNGDYVNFSIEEKLTSKIKELAQLANASLFVTLVSLVKGLLYRYTGQEDIIIGTPVTGREHKDFENQIGFYLNNLPIRTRFEGSDGFNKLLEKVKESVIGAYDHQIYPYDLLVNDLQVQRDMSRSSLFDVVVVLQNDALSSERESTDFSISSFSTDFKVSTVDLRIVFAEEGEKIAAFIEYNRDLFKEETIKSFSDRLIQMAIEFTERPELKIYEVNLADPVIEATDEISTEFNF